ncbi:MAG: hypothetical protein JWM57_1339 [Phycisphaerales bacterium]|nr:hypothetical protein [Phycisphaerales bacterium]
MVASVSEAERSILSTRVGLPVRQNAISLSALELLQARRFFSLTPTIGGDATTLEASSYQLQLSASGGTPTSWQINWGDNSEVQSVAGNPTSVAHSFTHIGSYAITASALDESGSYPATRWGVDVALDHKTAAGAPAGSHVVLQSDGKMILAGTLGGNAVVSRYLTNGDVDPSFGTNGVAQFSLGSIASVVSGVCVDSLNRIVLAGNANNQMVVARLTVDGGMDSSFDGDGIRPIAFSAASAATAVTTDAAGKVIVVGNLGGASVSFAMARLNTSGALDSTFDGDGLIATNFGRANSYVGAAVIVRPGAGIVVAANGVTNAVAAVLARFNIADGTLDSSFGSNGTLDVVFRKGASQVSSIAARSDGKIILGVNNSAGYLARYSASGTFEAASSTTKFVSVGSDGLAAQGDDKFVVVGMATVGTQTLMALSRFNGDGSPDLTFGIRGQVSLDSGSVPSVAVLGSQQIVTAVTADDNTVSLSRQRFDAGSSVQVTAQRQFSISGPTDAPSGQPYSLSLVSSNFDAAVASTWNVDWGDGTISTYQVNVNAGNPATVTHLYPQQTGAWTISATASDMTGTQSVGSLNVFVAGLQPFAPSLLTVLYAGAEDFFDWTSPHAGPAMDGYVIQRSADGVTGWVDVLSGISPADASASVPVARKAYYRIGAYNAAGVTYSGVSTTTNHPEDLEVTLSATVQRSPATITLHWPTTIGASYEVYRRLKGQSAWELRGDNVSGTSFADSSTVGTTYEYRVDRQLNSQVATGYIASGIDLPLVEDRGKLILLVDNRFVTSLQSELATLYQDLVGDGWTVIRHDVDPNASATSMHDLIHSDYLADPTRVKQVYLFGHVRVPQAGNLLGPDGHFERAGAWPADGYYGDMNGTWTDVNGPGPFNGGYSNQIGDGKFDQDVFAGDLKPELGVGRVDLHDIQDPLQPNASALDQETSLLRRYLQKEHAYRAGQWNIRQRALIELYSPNPAFSPQAFASFGPLVGPDQIETTDWLPWQDQPTYQYGYVEHDGGDDVMHSIITTRDLLLQDHPSVPMVFNTFTGSYFGRFDVPNNDFLRAPLGATGYALSNVWGLGTDWSFIHMGLGETIGYSAAFTQNGLNTEQSTSIYASLMGDPSLRANIVSPATNLGATYQGNGVALAWTASADAAVLGYNVYRSTSIDGAFTKISGSTPLASTAFIDTTAGNGHYVYMVRAVKSQETASGTYMDASEGAFFTGTPTVASSMVVGSGMVSRSFVRDVTLSFGAPVNLAAASIALTRRTGSGPASVAFSLASSDGGLTYVVTPSAAAASNGSFADGAYDLTISTSAVTSVAGGGSIGGPDRTYSFYRLTADGNGDGIVDFNDFLLLQNSFNQTFPAGQAASDTNGDNVVDFNDFLDLQNHFNMSITL